MTQKKDAFEGMSREEITADAMKAVERIVDRCTVESKKAEVILREQLEGVPDISEMLFDTGLFEEIFKAGYVCGAQISIEVISARIKSESEE